MGINVRVDEYTGELVDKWTADQRVDLLLELVQDKPESFPYLSCIDPYDDTVFNTAQGKRILRELEMVAAMARAAGCEEALTELCRLLDLLPIARRRPVHRLLRFIGD